MRIGAGTAGEFGSKEDVTAVLEFADVCHVQHMWHSERTCIIRNQILAPVIFFF